MMRSLLQSKIVLLLLCIVALIAGFRLSTEISRRMSIDREISDIQRRTAELRSERNSLSQMISKLSTDSFIESEARDKLNRVREGERVVVINPATAGDSQLQHLPQTFVQDWWRYFF